jgi:hypothetical protein
MYLLIEDQANFTSDPIQLRDSGGRFEFDLAIRGTLGAGTVAVQVLSSDGIYYSYPNLTFDENIYQPIALGASTIKIVITGATSATVEVN